MLTSILEIMVGAWAFLFLCSIPILTALIRAGQISRAAEIAGELSAEPYELQREMQHSKATKNKGRDSAFIHSRSGIPEW